MLTNPLYSGAYVYGLRQVEERLDEAPRPRSAALRPGGDLFQKHLGDAGFLALLFAQGNPR
jgi:hypothetical protein